MSIATGFHFQTGVNNMRNAIRLQVPGTTNLVVNDFFLADVITQENPLAAVWFRKWWDDRPSFGGDYETEKQRCRDYLDSFMDDTWRNNASWRWFKYGGFKELNEYIATSQTEAVRQQIIIHLQAWTHVYNTEYRGRPIMGGLDLPIALGSIPVGNDIDPRYAQIAQAADLPFSYHGYTWVQDGQIGGGLNRASLLERLATKGWGDRECDKLSVADHRALLAKARQLSGRRAVTNEVIAANREAEWLYFSGRWARMDRELRQLGITIKWVGTEGGPFLTVVDGWRSSRVYGGDLNLYVNDWVPYHMNRINQWNAANNGRYLGDVLFNVNRGTGVWELYNHDAGQMEAITNKVNEHAGTSPPPPDPEPEQWKIDAWRESEQNQIDRGIHYNTGTALFQAIKGEGYDLVTNETQIGDKVIQAGEAVNKPRKVWAFFLSDGHIESFTKPQGA